jgi:chromosome segregation ATPase
LKLVQLDDISQIYRELQGGVWDFVKLCNEAKAAKMSASQVVNLLGIANTNLPSVQRRYNQLQKENILLESIITNKSIEVQNLNSRIIEKRKSLDDIESEYRIKAAVLEGLQQQIAKVEAFLYNYKNNDEQHV